jgi:hypothetical protein
VFDLLYLQRVVRARTLGDAVWRKRAGEVQAYAMAHGASRGSMASQHWGYAGHRLEQAQDAAVGNGGGFFARPFLVPQAVRFAVSVLPGGMSPSTGDDALDIALAQAAEHSQPAPSAPPSAARLLPSQRRRSSAAQGGADVPPPAAVVWAAAEAWEGEADPVNGHVGAGDLDTGQGGQPGMMPRNAW